MREDGKGGVGHAGAMKSEKRSFDHGFHGSGKGFKYEEF
jgi:hypothetical protein